MSNAFQRNSWIALAGSFLFPSLAAAQQLLWEWTGPTGSSADDDAFGISVTYIGDMDGDGVVDALIGANKENLPGGGKQTGAVHLLSGATGNELRIQHGDKSLALFGQRVSGGADADGDGIGDYIVGCNLYKKNSKIPGAAFVYSGATGALLYDLYGENDGDNFGSDVEMIEDVDGDGRGDFSVAAGLFAGTGKVYVYSGATGQILYAVTGTALYEAMSFVCQLGDLNSDGIRDLGIGAFYLGAGSNGQGRFDAVDGPTGALLFSLEGEDHGDNFARGVTGIGDIDHDGVEDFMVAAPSHKENPLPVQPEGRIYVYSGATTAMLFQFDGVHDWELMGQPPKRGRIDVNGDGWSDVIFGSVKRNTSATTAGVMLAYSGRTGGLLYEFNLQDGAPIGGGLGFSSSCVGDMNVDGIDDIIVGAPGLPTNGHPGAGHVFVFAGNDLFLQSNAYSFLAGDTATLEIRGGEPGVLGLFVLTDVSGTPMFLPMLIGPLDAVGNLQLTGTVPSGLAGLSATFLGFAQKASGRGLIDSLPETIVFQ